MNDLFFAASLGIMIGLFVILLVVKLRILSVLRRRHPTVYLSIPRPIVFAEGNNDDNSGAILFFFSFLWRKEYVRLQDRELTRLCHIQKSATLIFLIVFGTCLMSYAAAAWNSGH